MPVYVPAFTGTHCAYPRRDGQAELTWVASYIPRWFTLLQTVTHPSTNQARRRLTSLMRPTTLPTEPNRRLIVPWTIRTIDWLFAPSPDFLYHYFYQLRRVSSGQKPPQIVMLLYDRTNEYIAVRIVDSYCPRGSDGLKCFRQSCFFLITHDNSLTVARSSMKFYRQLYFTT